MKYLKEVVSLSALVCTLFICGCKSRTTSMRQDLQTNPAGNDKALKLSQSGEINPGVLSILLGSKKRKAVNCSNAGLIQANVLQLYNDCRKDPAIVAGEVIAEELEREGGAISELLRLINTSEESL